MPAGLVVYNDDNILQIDGEFKNLCLRSKVTVTCNTAVTSGNSTFYRSGAQSYSGISNLVIAVRSSVNCMVYWVSSTQYVIYAETSGASVTVYLFGDPPAPTSDYGLRVYNDAGEVVFDAAREYMRVVDFKVLSTSTQEGSESYPSGRTYAVVLSGGFWGRCIATGAPSGSPSYYLHEWKRTAASFSGTTLTLHGVYVYSANSSGPFADMLYDSRSATYALVLDVTNY